MSAVTAGLRWGGGRAEHRAAQRRLSLERDLQLHARPGRGAVRLHLHGRRDGDLLLYGGHERSTAGQEGWHYSSVNAVVCETIVERQVDFQSSDCKWTSPFMNAFVCTNKHTETCRPSSLGGQESTAGPLRTEKEHSRGGQEMLTSGLSSADSSSCLLKRSETAGTF